MPDLSDHPRIDPPPDPFGADAGDGDETPEEGDVLELVAPPGSRGERLDRFLAEAAPDLSRTAWQRLLTEGAVTVNGRPGTARLKLRGGEAIVATIPAPEPSELVPVPMDLTILFEDAHLLILVKPAGLVVHPAPSVKEPTLVHGLLARGGFTGIGGAERPGIVHRLDKGTSGVMVVAKGDQAHRGLVERFKVHDIERRYVAILRGRPRDASGIWRSEIGRNPRNRLKMASVPKGGRVAVTHYRTLETYPGSSFVELRLQTGRTHQIRVHTSEQGHPVLGDPTYGGRAWGSLPPDPALQVALAALDHPLLHARVLGFEHPVTGEALYFEADPPDDFLEIHARLRALA